MKSRITLMLRAIAVALLLAAFWSISIAQDEIKRPPLRVPEVAGTVLQLVPPGWRAEESTVKEIDLSGDGKPDAAFVISNGRFDATGPAESTVVKHVLILALRGDDGKLHRSGSIEVAGCGTGAGIFRRSFMRCDLGKSCFFRLK
jgi:hypothetical protein